MSLDNDKSLENLPDTELMALVGVGEKGAFVLLIKRYQGPLANFFRRMGVYTGEEDDLVQDTFLRLFKYRKKYKPTARFNTFLYMLARQVRIDALRKGKRRNEFLARFAEEKAHETGSHEQHMGLGMDVRGAVDSLPEQLKAVVVLNVFQGLRYREIAEVLKVPLGTVKSRMFVALKRLKEYLHEDRR
jgi:RNA polymerase sigma-70 factor (ECF subfamily)